MSLSTLTIKYIPAIFPNVDFTDTINVNTYRFVDDIELEIVEIRTDKPYKVVDFTNLSQNWLIQTQVYEKGILYIDVNENQKIDLSKVADSVTIVTDEGEEINAEVLDISYTQFTDIWKYRAKLSIKKLKNDELSVNSYLISDNLLDSEDGRFATTELNRLNLTTNPAWINIKIEGDQYFENGEDFSIDNKDFGFKYNGGGTTTVTVIVDATATPPPAYHQQVVNAINTAVGVAGVTEMEAYNGGRFVGFRSTTSVPADTFEFIAGTTDDLLVFLGVSAGIYSNNVPLDSTFDGESNAMTFHTRLEPEFKQTLEENESELVDGIQLPVYSNEFLTITLDFFLDNVIAKYGTYTEAQAFDYYVGQTWYIDTASAPKGEEIDIRATTQYDALENIAVEKIENDALIGVEHRRVTMKYAQLQNYRYR